MYQKGKRERWLINYLCSLGKVVTCEFAFQSEFVHNPICLLSLWSSSSIEHKGLLHPHKIVLPFVNLFVLARGLPIPRLCCSIGSHTSWILPIPLAKEVPIFLPHLCFLYTPNKTIKDNNNNPIQINGKQPLPHDNERWLQAINHHHHHHNQIETTKARSKS